MATSFFGGSFFNGEFFNTAPVVVDVFGLGQGDDHPGWDKKAWKKQKKKEEALEQTIVRAYQKLHGIEPTQTFVKKVAKEVKAEIQVTKEQFEDYSGVIAWLQAQEAFVNEYLRKLELQREMDDEEAILLLM